MISNEQSINRYVDGYFLPHFSNTKYNHQFRQDQNADNFHNRLQKQSITSHKNNVAHRNTMLDQHDIDQLQLMNPKMTPEHYMKNILNYYDKEKKLKSKKNRNQHQRKVIPAQVSINQFSPCKKGYRQLQNCVIDEDFQHEQDNEDEERINQLKDACYIGLGKTLIGRKEGEKKIELGKSNYHTRQYLLPRVMQEVACLQLQNMQKHNRKYYIIANANARGISFDVDRMPPQLKEDMSIKTFQEVIYSINSIIQKTVYTHKTEANYNKKISPLYFWLSLSLFAIISLLIANHMAISSQIIQTGCLVISICMILFLLMLSCHRFYQPLNYVSLIDRIDSKITEYLNYVSSKPDSNFYWKTSTNLYWLQVTKLE